MTLVEQFEAKRQKFLNNANFYFHFLVEEFGYEKIDQIETTQPNGVIICDEIIFENKQIDRRVIILNAYHPVDYGFEVGFYKPSESLIHSDRAIALYVLKENQDLEQSYIEPIAEKLKAQFSEQIRGQLWF